MRRIVPLATTVAVIAATAVSAGQRTMELPGSQRTGPGYVPPMFEAGAKPAPMPEWPSDKLKAQTKNVEPETGKDKGVPENRDALGSASMQSAAVPASPDADIEKSHKPKDSVYVPGTPRKAASSLPEKSPGKAASSASPAPVATAGKPVSAAQVPAAAPVVEKIRDVTADPKSDDLLVQRAKDEIRAGAKKPDAPAPGVETVSSVGAPKPDESKAGDARLDGQKPAAKNEARSQKAEAPLPPKPHFTGQQGKAKAIALASLHGEDGNGDRLHIERAFQNWKLSCAMQITRNERICAIHQNLREGEAERFSWQIATTATAKPVVVFDFTAQADPAAGLHISIAGFDKIVPATEWACEGTRCTTSMPIVGPVSSWFTNSSQIRFRYQRDGVPVTLDASMAGFETAVQALANPLGLKTGGESQAATTLGKTAQAN